MLDAQLALESKAGISLAVGVLTGLMTMLVPTMGLLFSGLQLGGLLAVTALVVVGQFHSLSSLWVPLGGSLAASVLFAIITLLWQKPFAIIYTSALGACAVTLCVDHLMGASALPDQVYDMLHQGAPRRLCWFNWAIAGIFPALSLVGVLVQWSLTARGLSHRAGELRDSAPNWQTEIVAIASSSPVGPNLKPSSLYPVSPAVQLNTINTRSVWKSRNTESQGGGLTHTDDADLHH